MMICKECGNEQGEGKFCGLCGGDLVEKQEDLNLEEEVGQEDLIIDPLPKEEKTSEDSRAQTELNNQVNESVEMAKEKLSTFLGFFKTYIKRPMNILGNAQEEFINGIISIVFNFLVLSLTISLVGKNTLGIYTNYSVIGNLFKTFIVLAISIILIGGFSFVLNKFFGVKIGYKEFIAIYGAYMLPIIILSVLSLLLSIISSNAMAITLTLIAISLSILVIPNYLVIILLSRSRSSIDPFYGQIIYLVGAAIVNVILITVVIDSALGDVLNNMNYYF